MPQGQVSAPWKKNDGLQAGSEWESVVRSPIRLVRWLYAEIPSPDV